MEKVDIFEKLGKKEAKAEDMAESVIKKPRFASPNLQWNILDELKNKIQLRQNSEDYQRRKTRSTIS